MATYSYFAKTKNGDDASGTIEAADELDLARKLRQGGLVLIEAVKKGQKKKRLNFSFSFGKTSLKDKIMFTRNLQVMVSAGVPLPRAIRILAEQSKSAALKKALLDVIDEITKGGNFADGLSRHPNVFSELFVNMVRVGEETGTLEEVFKTLTLQMERQYELTSKIIGALTYPAVILCAMMGIGLLMLVAVVPKLAVVFEEMNIEFPMSTKIVIGLGLFLSSHWYLLPLFAGAFLFGLRAFLKTPFGKRSMDGLFLRLPMISGIIKKANSASAMRSFSSLIKAGVPVVRALEIVAGALGNIYFKKALLDCAQKVKEGTKLSEALAPYESFFSAIMVQMVEIGEETGQTSDVLGKLADFFEEEVTNITKNLSSIIEPILMLLIGGAVGFFAISMVQPMYSMMGTM